MAWDGGESLLRWRCDAGVGEVRATQPHVKGRGRGGFLGRRGFPRMKGIHGALQDASARTWSCAAEAVRIGAGSVGVGEGDDLTWVSVSVFEEKARTLAGSPTA